MTSKKVNRYRIEILAQSWSAVSPEQAKGLVDFMLDMGMVFSITRVQIPSGEITK